jgi:transposase
MYQRKSRMSTRQPYRLIEHFVAVFGLLKRGGKGYTAIIPNAKTQTLMPSIEEHVRPDSIVRTYTFRS